MDLKYAEQRIRNGYKLSKKVTRKSAKTFYFASIFLNKQQKRSAYAIYAICRITDDYIDISDNPNKKIQEIENQIAAAYNNEPIVDNDILLAFKDTIHRYKIPKQYFDDLIKGMFMDLEKKHYESFDELYLYCYRVAGVIGLIMLCLFGYKNIQAQQHAVDLGIAMQLTNILRDIKEDYSRGRIYIPANDLEKFKVSKRDIGKQRLTPNFVNLIKFEIQKARDFYKNSSLGIFLITNWRSRLVVYIMKELYSGILEAIEKAEYNVFKERVFLSFPKKIIKTIRIIIKGKYL